MLTDKQLQHLITFIEAQAQYYSDIAPCPEHEVKATRKALIRAFGFETDRRGRAVIVPHAAELVCPPVNFNGVALKYSDGAPVLAGELKTGTTYHITAEGVLISANPK